VSVSPSSTAAVIGREAELAAAKRFLDSLPEGPAALVIEGEPGIGKTTVWREAKRDAEGNSYCVLSCRPGESETKLSFSSLADLIGPVADQVLSELPEPQRRGLEAALLRADVESGVLDQRAVAAGFLSTLLIFAETTPVLVGVDDVQWLDAPSRRVLEFAARRLGDAPIGVIVTRRAEGEVPVPLRLDRATAESRLERLRLGPLSAAAIHQLVKESLGVSLPRPTLVKLQRASAGNPFYALEIAAALREVGDDATASGRLPIPSEVTELISRRIRRLPPPTKEALLEASGLAHPTVELVDEEALVPAEGAKLIAISDDGRVTFRHPIFAAAVYGTASAPLRRRLHRRLAERVTDVEERGRHLALAAEAPDESVARILDLAAARARSRGAPDAAAELAEEACRLTPASEVDALRQRKIEAAEHHFRAGDLGRARELLDGVVGDPDCGASRARARFLLASVCHHEHSFPEALELLDRAREEAGDDPRLGAEIDFELAFVHESCGDIDSAEAPAKRALAQAERLGQSPMLAEALAIASIVDFLQGRGLDDRIDRALALEDPDRQVPLVLRPSLIAAHLDLYVGQLDRAGDRLRSLRRRVIERGEETDLPFACGSLAWLECRRGDLDAAARFAEEGLESARQLESQSLLGYALAFAAFVDSHRGEAPAARTEASDAVALFEQTGWQTGLIWALAGLGLLELSLGDFAAVDRALDPLVQPVEAAGVKEPIHAFFLTEEIEALIGLGSLERAERLLRMLENRALLLKRTWAQAAGARCRGLLIAAQGDLATALRKLNEALEFHEQTGMPIELARTLLAKGQIERRARRKAPARTSLHEAKAIFERQGARLWAERASAELDSLGLSRSGHDELSPAERRVAELAASGHTNREIAASLYMSPKTVEAHLAHTYRKLGIRSRAQLGTRLADTKNSSTTP
jgi:DNA-binding CsgD family transcriptional regulator/tetratricopeptide (TPR) repeat protein